MAKKQTIFRLAEGEIEFLQMLWREGKVTILEAQRALGLPIGYTTVQTRLNRLVKKGAAAKSKQRPAKYSAAITPDIVREQDLNLLVDRVSEGQVYPLVAQLMSRQSISSSEIENLKRLLAQAEKRTNSARTRRAKK